MIRREYLKNDYTLSGKDRTLIAVHRNVHELLSYRARENRMTVVQATYEIIKAGFKGVGRLG